ncbi:ribose 5-phosphate isomerase B [Vicingaceae bacterium]|nr:ribose 5-phosphate isomerase B [Vicingaceae bacterium]MDB4061364.1 ribose 5-phosphate isomerase B [Vicingaceae bacterium]MDC1451966.1 ribose 5-phosphate isomerase B [Vicingaceae bacterium]
MKIAIGGDHAGFEYKQAIKNLLEGLGHIVEDFGPFSDESCDYPDIAHPLAMSVESKKNELGIGVCGSGNGINMTLNKHQDIRSALCWEVELARLARQHNNANVLALPSRFISLELAKKCAEAFVNEEFEGGRHERRVNKIKQ